MPFYEFTCDSCDIYFEIGQEMELDISNAFCVDCGSAKLTLVRYNKELGTRIENLANDIKICNERIERIEDAMLESGISDNEQNFEEDETKN